jgi:hypothetical protein
MQRSSDENTTAAGIVERSEVTCTIFVTDRPDALKVRLSEGKPCDSSLTTLIHRWEMNSHKE